MQASKQARCAFSEVVVQIDDALSQGIYSLNWVHYAQPHEKRNATVNKT